MFHTYRSAKKTNSGKFIWIFILIILLLWGYQAYKGVNIKPKPVVKTLTFPDEKK